MIVATAGHIDHGKTSLVRFLTGVDTDRLPEERKRGISIDLGFAHVNLGDGVDISFIDVPGHERFIRNMLAGVIGIDAALLVIAVDDGVMPQTQEHLRILELLQIRKLAVVLSKIDKVSSQRIQDVEEAARLELNDTNFKDATFFPVSVSTGEGIAGLKDWLREYSVQKQDQSDGLYRFRMPVDRSFTIAGSGTVITGTVHSGHVKVGDRLMISPSGGEVRVRGIQVHGVSTELVKIGQRCALNLSGISVDEVERGDWVLDPASHAPTNRMDVRLKVLHWEDKPLCHWTNVHIHLGTANMTARIVLPAEGCIQPGESMFAQLLSDQSVSAIHGDRFIVRDQSGSRTIGGGVVLDPHAQKRTRRASKRVAELQIYERNSPFKILSGLLDISDSGVDLSGFAQSLNLSEAGAQDVFTESGALILGKTKPLGINRRLSEEWIIRILDRLRQFHRSNPKESGMTIARLQVDTDIRLRKSAFHSFVRDLANRQLLILSNDIVHLRGHVSSANPEDEKLWQSVHQVLLSLGVQVPLVAELSKNLKVKEQYLRDFLHRKSRTGEIRRITEERFCLKEILDKLVDVAVNISNQSADGFFTAADFRNAIGTGRGLAIHYLEFFDQIGVTQRFGDRRRMGKGFV